MTREKRTYGGKKFSSLLVKARFPRARRDGEEEAYTEEVEMIDAHFS